MTVAQLLPVYMNLRRELIAARLPLRGWTVQMSVEDASDIQLERPHPIGSGEHVYGSDWFTNAAVPPGELWVTVPGQPVRVITIEANAVGHVTGHNWIEERDGVVRPFRG